MKRTTRTPLVVALTLVVALPCAYVGFAHWRGGRELAGVLAERRRLGEALTLAELAPPPVSDHSNAVEQFLAAVRRLPSEVVQLPGEELLERERVLLRTQVEAWRAARTPTGTNTWADVSVWITAHSDALDALETSLAAPSRHRFEAGRAPEDWVPRHLSAVKQAQLVLGVACYDAIRRDDFDRALSLMRSMARLEQDLASQPYLIAHLVRFACAHQRLQCAWNLFARNSWNESRLAELQTTLQSTGLAEGAALGIAGEGLVVLHAVKPRLAPHPAPPVRTASKLASPDDLALITPDSNPTEPELAGRAVRFLTRRGILPIWRYGWLDHALAAHLRMNQELLAAARAATRDRSLARFRQVASKWLAQPEPAPARFRGFGPGGIPAEVVIGRGVVKGVDEAIHKAFRAENHRALLEARIALERFRRQEGRYPETLGSLVPDFLGGLPTDAMDGRPLRYRTEGAGADFTLWSIGSDLEDQGGDASPPPGANPSSSSWLRARDAVLPKVATAEDVVAWNAARAKRASEIGTQRAPGLGPEMRQRYGLGPDSGNAP